MTTLRMAARETTRRANDRSHDTFKFTEKRTSNFQIVFYGIKLGGRLDFQGSSSSE